MNSPSSLARIRVILSRPSHPGNIGATARAMKTMGLSQLVLICPKRFPDEEATARASGANDLLQQARVCATLDEALSGTTLVAGMTARKRDLAAPFLWPRDGAEALVQGTQTGHQTMNVALLFGNETAGLSNEELSRCHLGITIPTNPEYSSLNLASAVQLMSYELRLAAMLPELPPPSGQDFLPATSEEIEGLHSHLEQVALATGFLDPHQPKRLMARLRRLFARARLEHDEVSILRGFLSAIERPKKRRTSPPHTPPY